MESGREVQPSGAYRPEHRLVAGEAQEADAVHGQCDMVHSLAGVDAKRDRSPSAET